VVHRKEGDDNMYVPLEIVPSDVEENDERYAQHSGKKIVQPYEKVYISEK
jgi:hypothetical protein